ncbi:methytransferase partner Trm112 [Chloroflexota bacterium]
MKKALMEILACPVCKGHLALDIAEEDENEVIKGKLSCTHCSHQYPIEDGIPDLLPPNLRD